jgi:hypothetical protein
VDAIESHPCLTFAEDDPVAERYGLGAAAFRYVSWGYAVIPLIRGGKRPHRIVPYSDEPGARNGVWHASDSPDQVAGWWAQDRAANIGVATGSRSALAVIDLDVKRGEDGPGNFTRFLGGYPLPAACAWTPSGGWHLWLRLPPGLDVPERPSILPGVDLKGSGGLVAAAPSMTLHHPRLNPGESGDPFPVSYRWERGCPCSAPLAPGWLIEWACSAPERDGAGGSNGGDYGSLLGLDELARTGIPVGQRNYTTYRLACSGFRKYGTGGDGWAMVAEDLGRVLAATDTRGFTAGELRTIMSSAHRFVAGLEAAEASQVRSWERSRGRVR